MKDAKALWFHDRAENHDKVHITVLNDNVVTTYWGRRGAMLSFTKKAGGSFLFDKIVGEKQGKGYMDNLTRDDLKRIVSEIAKHSPVDANILVSAYSLGVYVREPAVSMQEVSVSNPLAVRCIDNVGFEDHFETGVDYYCVKLGERVMVVQDMFGKARDVSVEKFEI